MTALENKQRMRDIFDALAQGNGKPFIESLDDDFCWIMQGSTDWSGVYRGKQAVLDQLFKPLFARFAGQYTNTAHRIIAEDDYVVVECRGKVETKAGMPYNNAYCYVCRMEQGRMKELTEYLDTQLVAAALGDPVSAAAH